MTVTAQKFVSNLAVLTLLVAMMALVPRAAGAGQPGSAPAETAVSRAGGEANLVVPDLSSVDFRGVNGRTLLMGGLVVCALGLLFGLMTFTELKNLPVHPSMRE